MNKKNLKLNKEFVKKLFLVFSLFLIFFSVTKIVTATDISISAIVGSGTTSTGSTSGGGGGGGYTPTTPGIVISGYAYPSCNVYMLENGQQTNTVTADSIGAFSITDTNVTPGVYTYSLGCEDSSGRRATPYTVTLTIPQNYLVNIANIVLAPTVSVSHTTFTVGTPLTITGTASSLATITALLSGSISKTLTFTAGMNGEYNGLIPTTDLALGDYTLKVKSTTYTGHISSWGNVFAIQAGLITKKNKNFESCDSGIDLNNDCRLNIKDFSILAYWYGKNSPPKEVDFNHDGKIDLSDFSILAYNWTG